MLNEHDLIDFGIYPEGEEQIQAINPEDIAGFDIRRSPTDYKLFNLFAVDFMNKVLYPCHVGIPYEEAVGWKKRYDSAAGFTDEYTPESDEEF